MGDYRDIERKAKEEGFSLDLCGTEERSYSWGLYYDFCGMSVEDAKNAASAGGGGGSSKKKNVVTFTMEKNADEYELVITTQYAPSEPVTVNLTIDGEPKILTIPSGQKIVRTGIKQSSKYATIENITFSADEEYIYSAKNEVKDGKFTYKIILEGNTTANTAVFGTEINLPIHEDREGYDFKWTDQDGNEYENSFTIPEKDITVTGKYIVKSYTLTYTIYEEILSGSNLEKVEKESDSITVTFGEKILKYVNSKVPARSGYSLTDWKNVEDGTEITDSTTMPSHDISIDITYTLNKYILSYAVEGEEYTRNELYFGEEITPIVGPTKIGYEFFGWDQEIPKTMPAKDIFTNAVFKVLQFAIEYYVDDELKYSELHDFGSSITIRPDEEKEGYTFSGWDATLPSTMPAENLTVNGTFTINSYTLTLFKDNGVIHLEKEYEFNTTIEPVEEPTKEGYTFTKWVPSIPPTMPSHDVECTAEYTINSHYIIYYVGTEEFYRDKYEYGATIELIDEPTKKGYTFSGWSHVPEVTMPDNDIYVSGNFTINHYDLIYMVDGEEYARKTLEYNQTIFPLPYPSEKEGYTFSGWIGIPERELMPDEDVVVNGYYNINSHELIYKVDDKLYTSVTLNYNEKIIFIDQPEKEGYNFSGWEISDYSGETMPDKNVIVNGYFIIKSYTFNYYISNGRLEPFTSITYNYGDTVIKQEPPEWAGYNFLRWNPEEPDTVPDGPDVRNFYGIWEEAKYNLTFIVTRESTGEEVYNNTEEKKFGETIEYPTIELGEQEKLEWDYSGTTMPNNDLTINGIIKEITLSNEVYYGTALHNDIPNLTVEQITSLNSYDGAGLKENAFNCIIPMSEEYAEWSRLLDEADDEGDDDLVEYYQELMDNYRTSHQFGALFIIPETFNVEEISKYNGSAYVSIEPSLIKTIEINNTIYSIFEYTINNQQWQQCELDITYKFKIKLK